jgi:hypothetical protein
LFSREFVGQAGCLGHGSRVLLLYLLKHQYQPERRGKSWRLTINHQRTAIERLLEQSPSLRRLLDADSLDKGVRP